jgi:hypothetical protein
MTTAIYTGPKGRENELWSSANGNLHCVSERCMGFNLFSEIGNNIRQGKTFDGAYRFTADERAFMKDFLINECGDANPTCECGRVAF